MNRVSDLAPGADLVGAVKAGGADDAMRLVGHLGAFVDDQAGRGALRIVFNGRHCKAQFSPVQHGPPPAKMTASFPRVALLRQKE